MARHRRTTTAWNASNLIAVIYLIWYCILKHLVINRYMKALLIRQYFNKMDVENLPSRTTVIGLGRKPEPPGQSSVYSAESRGHSLNLVVMQTIIMIKTIYF